MELGTFLNFRNVYSTVYTPESIDNFMELAGEIHDETHKALTNALAEIGYTDIEELDYIIKNNDHLKELLSTFLERSEKYSHVLKLK